MNTVGGNSALGQAVLFGLEAEAVERRITELRRTVRVLRQEERNWLAGGRGELSVARLLDGMDDAGWRVLADRRWPGAHRANIDMLLVGPGGVFVVDAKNWQDARVERGRLRQRDADAAVARLTRQTEAVEDVLAAAGLAPTQVVPLLVLVGRRQAQNCVGRVVVVGELDLVGHLVRRGLRLESTAVDRVVDILDRHCPPMVARSPRRSGGRPADATIPLLDRDRLRAELVEVAARDPIESWMTWLHPDQAQLVKRHWSGPARIRGGAGTGKTVLALHRAKYLAARGDAVLFTVFVKSLADVYRSLFGRLAPELVDRVEFAAVSAVAMGIVGRSGVRAVVDDTALRTCFARAWSAVRHDSPLPAVAPSRYWHQEITHVVKGRGVTTFEQYAQLPRVGRRTRLPRPQRAAVWRLYEEYERFRAAAGVLDWADVQLLARDRVRAGAERLRYDAVIVDEVQDLSCVGLQLVHGLLRREADGLLLVGDGQQSIYPGGFTLAEAGISVQGRATVLDRNYRNAEDVWRCAVAVVGDDPYDDLDSEPVAEPREVDVVRPGGRVVRALPCRQDDQPMVLATHIRGLRDGGVRLGDLAVLVSTNDAVHEWLRALRAEGLPVSSLLDYDGTRSETVKVGTFHRAKGLEFGHVLVPSRNRWPQPRQPGEPEQAFRERAELQRRQLFVALTRARDGLWLGATF